MPDADTKTIRLRRYSWKPGSEITVDLRTRKHSPNEWDVIVDGKVVGIVTRYSGTLDRQIGRLRSPGVTRTLWGRRGLHPQARTIHGSYSRAEAIRDLIQYSETRS